MSKLQLLTKGIIRENPTFVLLLGMCPTLGTTTSAVNGMGMGLATLFVLTLSNVVISLVKNLIPAQVRIPSFIVVIAAFVTVVQLCMEAYTPDLYNTLGVYIPLIVVNCIILGRAEAFASKNNVLDSAMDGLGIGLGLALLVCLMLKAKMKSARQGAEADAYVTAEGLNLTEQYDHYTHTTETRRKISSDSDSSSHSGGGGSGSSGKY